MQLNSAFPAVDPIPLPAPIWLLKLLHIVTLSLHFVAVEMLIGGLLLAVILSLFGRGSNAHVAARALAHASSSAAQTRVMPALADRIVSMFSCNGPNYPGW